MTNRLTTDRKFIANIRKSCRKKGFEVMVTTIGTGKYCDIGLHGADAALVAGALERAGWKRTPMSGAVGASQWGMITLTPPR